MTDKKQSNWKPIIAGVIVLIMTFGFVGWVTLETIHTIPTSKMTDYSYNGEIIDVHFTGSGFFTTSETIVQFERVKTLTFYGSYYEIRRHQNATINYSVNKYNTMFFNDVTYEK